MPPLSAFGQPIGEPLAGWTRRETPSAAIIPGRHCRLERLNAEKHAAGLYAAFQEAPDARDWTYMSFGPFDSVEKYREHVEAVSAETGSTSYAIVDSATGAPLGSAALMRIDPGNGVLEVGRITYAPKLQRRPAGTEAMYLLMRYVFDDLRYRRYEWKCDALHARSRRAAERYGFRFEGIFRQAIIYKGRTRDTAWFSIIDSEWPAIRRDFENWLDPANFDEAGRQRRSLADFRV